MIMHLKAIFYINRHVSAIRQIRHKKQCIQLSELSMYHSIISDISYAHFHIQYTYYLRIVKDA